MQQYAEIHTCRRQYILNYFGERFADNCGNCDCCKKELMEAASAPVIVEPKTKNITKSIFSISIPQQPAEGEDLELLRQLKALRLEFANQEHKPAFVIFSDKTIHDIALRQPTTMDELKECNGIGDFKADKYGEAFLNIVRKHKSIDSVPSTPPRNSMEAQKQQHANAYAPWSAEDDQLLMALFNRGNTIAEMMVVFHRNEGAIRSRLKKLNCNR